MTINDIEIGGSAVVETIGGEGVGRMHFLDMGLTPGTPVQVVSRAPLGDPIQLLVRGYALTLRKQDAASISVRPVEPEPEKAEAEAGDDGRNAYLHDHNAHPGLGEGGKYHSKDHENALPKGTVLTFALAGQQNCGKTTLFNVLTGSSQHVGNFPGVTVDRKDGAILAHPNRSEEHV